MAVHEVVPFLAVHDIRVSAEYYTGGLGFTFEKRWAPKGELRWCQLRLGGAALMLQQFPLEGHDARQFSNPKGEGLTLCFFLDDAIEFYRTVRARELEATQPCVSNGLWTTMLTDPDGYRLLFESPTDEAEGSVSE